MYRDIIKDTEIYQIIFQEGVEKGLALSRQEGFSQGLQEGLPQGRQEGRVEILREVILDEIQERFPELLELATRTVSSVTDQDTLKQLARDVRTAGSHEQALALFAALNKDQGY